jgi:hypothetical protein
VELIQEIGSYAGFAAVLGLAVLAALYFSQARDVKRLREWAGRAPERDAEARARVAAAGAGVATPAAQPQTGQAQPAKPAAKPATAAAGNSGGNSTATPTPAAVPTAAAATKAPAIGAGGAGRPGTATAARPAQRVSAQTSILRGQQPDPLEPWYRRIAPRYIALIVAGVLVVGGGIAVGVVQLLGDDSGSGSTPAAEEREGGQQPEQAASTPLRPADISVAVLNATPVPGLAAQFGDRVESEGFQRDNVGNFNGGQRAESVVLYAPGRKRHAALVRRRFDVNAIEPVDEQLRSQVSPNADVFLVVGADKTQ